MWKRITSMISWDFGFWEGNTLACQEELDRLQRTKCQMRSWEKWFPFHFSSWPDFLHFTRYFLLRFMAMEIQYCKSSLWSVNGKVLLVLVTKYYSHLVCYSQVLVSFFNYLSIKVREKFYLCFFKEIFLINFIMWDTATLTEWWKKINAVNPVFYWFK